MFLSELHCFLAFTVSEDPKKRGKHKKWAEALKSQKPAGNVGEQGARTWVRLGIFHGEFESPEKWLGPRILWNFLLVHNNLKVILGGGGPPGPS